MKMSNFGYFDYGHDDRSSRRDRDDYDYRAVSTLSTRGNAVTSFDYGHGESDRDRKWSPPRGRESIRNDRRNEPLLQQAPSRGAGLLETPLLTSRYQDFEAASVTRDRVSPPPLRSRSPLLGSRQRIDDFNIPSREQPYETRNYYDHDRKPEPVRRRSRDRDRQERYGPRSDEPLLYQQPLLPEPDLNVKPVSQRSFSPEYSRNNRHDRGGRNSRLTDFERDKPLLPDPALESRSLQEDLYQRPSRRSFSPERRTNDGDRTRRSERGGRQDTRSARPALLPEPESFGKQKSIQDVLGSFVQPGLQDVQTQMKMEQALFQSQELLQKLEKKGHEKVCIFFFFTLQNKEID